MACKELGIPLHSIHNIYLQDLPAGVFNCGKYVVLNHCFRKRKDRFVFVFLPLQAKWCMGQRILLVGSTLPCNDQSPVLLMALYM